MSLESDLKTRLRALCSNRAWPDFRPPTTGTTTPYITWQVIGGKTIAFLEGGVPSKRNARVQVNVWAADRETANNLIRSVEADFLSDVFARPIGAFVSTYEPEMKLYGAQQDFSVYYDA